MERKIFLKIAKVFVFFSVLFLVSITALSTKAYGADKVATLPEGPDIVYGLTATEPSLNSNISDFSYIYAYVINEYDQIEKYFVEITTKEGKTARIDRPNNLAVRRESDGLKFYFKRNVGTRMYKANVDGVIEAYWDDDDLDGSARSGTFLPNGKYVTTSDQASNKTNELYIYNVDDGARGLEKKMTMVNETSEDLKPNKLKSMGDIVSDAEGYLYATISESEASNTTVLKINSINGAIVDILPVPKLKHSPAITFMKDGRLLLSDSDDKGAIVDFATGVVTYTDKFGVTLPKMGGTKSTVRDFASLNFPSFMVELFAIKSGPETATYGEEFDYTIKVGNTGNIMSLHNFLKDSLSDYLEYVPNSTMLNGNKVADVNGTSSLFSHLGMKIESPGGVEGAITKDEIAVITFRVKVKDTGDTTVGIEIPNIAHVINETPRGATTNTVLTKVPGIPISEFILNLHIKQEVLNGRLDLVSPTTGFATVKNSIDQYKMMIPSYINDTNQSFKLVKIKASDTNNPYNISLDIPEFYAYAGYQLTQTESTHLSVNRINTPIEAIDLSKGLDRWLTAYIEPKLMTDAPPFYSWDYKTNDFGKITVK